MCHYSVFSGYLMTNYNNIDSFELIDKIINLKKV